MKHLKFTSEEWVDTIWPYLPNEERSLLLHSMNDDSTLKRSLGKILNLDEDSWVCRGFDGDVTFIRTKGVPDLWHIKATDPMPEYLFKANGDDFFLSLVSEGGFKSMNSTIFPIKKAGVVKVRLHVSIPFLRAGFNPYDVYLIERTQE